MYDSIIDIACFYWNVNVNVWNMTIACALRWGVASVENILYWAWLSLYGKIFKVQGVHRWMVLIRGCNCEESRIVVLIVIL